MLLVERVMNRLILRRIIKMNRSNIVICLLLLFMLNCDTKINRLIVFTPGDLCCVSERRSPNTYAQKP